VRFRELDASNGLRFKRKREVTSARGGLGWLHPELLERKMLPGPVGFSFWLGGRTELLTRFSCSLFWDEGSGACRANLAAHRCSHLL
jgi:hypothetical protein